jgi:hypothetical protein
MAKVLNEVNRLNQGQGHLLSTNGVYRLTRYFFDLPSYLPAQREEAVAAWEQRANEAST